MLADGMRTARLAVATQQRVFAGFDKDKSDRMMLAEMFQERRELLELFAFASVNEKRGACETAVARGVEFGKDRNQLDWKVVHAIKAHVLEGMKDGAFSGAG
jgi:hypothetical protein